MNKFLKKYILFSIVCILAIIMILININANYMTSKIEKERKAETTTSKGTIVNVPVDSRPVSRSNFQYLVNAAGYNYVEISDGLDSCNGTNYTAGTPSTVSSSLTSKLPTYNDTNTTVIINTSAYHFGGLVAANDYSKYSNLDTSNIATTISSNLKPKYYIVTYIPSGVPDFRVNPLPSGIASGDTLVSGLQDYYTKDVSGATDIATSTSFNEATLEWEYFHYYNIIKAAEQGKQQVDIYNELPKYAQNFCAGFYNSNSAFLDSYAEMYNNYFSYINNIKTKLSSISGANYQILICSGNIILPYFMQQHLNDTGNAQFNFIEFNSNNTVKKYSGQYYLLNGIEDSAYTIIDGGDDANYLILAKDMVEKNNNGVKFNYLSTGDNTITTSYLDSLEGQYDSTSMYNSLLEKSNFINTKTTSTKSTVDTYIDTDSTLDTTGLNKAVTKIYDSTNTNITSVIGLGITNQQATNVYGGFPQDLFKSLITNHNIFDIAYCGSYGNIGTYTGITLSASTICAEIEKDLSDKSLAINTESNVKNRLLNYKEFQIVSTLGGYFNENKSLASSSDLAKSLCNPTSDVNLMDEITSETYKAGEYKYKLSNASITASLPWNRNSEVKIVPTIQSLELVATDTTPPTIDVTVDPSTITRNDVKVTITATDAESGLADNPYSFDGGKTWQTSSTNTYSENKSEIVIMAKNGDGLTSKKTISISNIDKIVPTDDMPTVESENGTSATIKCNQVDNESGVASIIFGIKEDTQTKDTRVNETNNTHLFTDLKSNTQYTIQTVATDKAGNITISLTNKFTTSTINATSVNYTTEYWLQNVNDDNYTIKDSITETGKVGESVTPTVKAYTGFTPPTAQTVTISADGTTKIVYKYTRNKHTVTVNKGEGIKSVTGAGTYKYEQKVTLVADVEDGYSGLTWTGDTTTGIIDSMPDKDLTVNVLAKKAETPTSYEYKIKYDVNAPNSTKVTGTMSDSQFKSNIDNKLAKNEYAIDGYTFKWWNTKADGTGTTYTDEEKFNYTPTQANETITLYAQWKKTTDTALEITIKYSITDLTNQDVVVTIISTNELKSVDGWTLSTDKKSMAKTYTENKTETVKVIDINDQEKDAEIKVSNIDKTKPEIKVTCKENLDGTITVTITSNKKLKGVDGWTLSTDGLTLTKTYTKGTSDNITIKDLAGNEVTEKILATTTNTTNTTNTSNTSNTTTEESIDSKKDDTTANTSIPKTGEKAIASLIIITVIIATISFIKYKKIIS